MLKARVEFLITTCLIFINVAAVITFIVEHLCCFYEKIMMLGKGEWDPIVFIIFITVIKSEVRTFCFCFVMLYYLI